MSEALPGRDFKLIGTNLWPSVPARGCPGARPGAFEPKPLTIERSGPRDLREGRKFSYVLSTDRQIRKASRGGPRGRVISKDPQRRSSERRFVIRGGREEQG